MKKIFSKLLILGIIFIPVLQVKAYDTENINISNYINFPYLTEISDIEISLDKELWDNNDIIYYQFLKVDDLFYDKYISSVEETNESLKSCKATALQNNDYKSAMEEYKKIEEKLKNEGKTDSEIADDESYKKARQTYREKYNNYVEEEEKCYDEYDIMHESIENSIPVFDESKWLEATLKSEDNRLKSNIINTEKVSQFILWIKALDENNEPIYNYGVYSNKSTNDDDDEIVFSDGTEDINDDIKSEDVTNESTTKNPKTGVYTFYLGGLIVILISGLFYTCLKRKNKFPQI